MGNKKRLKLIALAAGIVVLLGAIWGILQGAEKLLAGKKHGAPVAAEERRTGLEDRRSIRLKGTTYTYDASIESYLFLGTDGSGAEEEEGEAYEGSMADFLLLAVIDRQEGSYGFLQLDRDTMTEVTMMQKDGTGYASGQLQLCTAHWYGGNKEQSCENTVEAVSKLLGGVAIDGYYSLNMEHIPKLNHAVGGVEVTVQGDFSKVDASLKEGRTLTLKDEQAYRYVRSRYGVGKESNQERMQRQKQYLQGFFAKVQARVEEEPGFVNQLYQDLEDVAVSDLRGKDLSRIMKGIQGGESQGILQMEGSREEGQALGDGIDHTEFYPEDASVVQVMRSLYGLKRAEEEE